MVTASPELEILKILKAIEIDIYFKQVFGSPRSKESAIRSVLEKTNVPAKSALVVGDSKTDLTAAQANGICFWLRRTQYNHDLRSEYEGPQFSDLKYE